MNSLLAQSASIEPNILIVDIGGSYNRLTQFLGGQVRSLEPGQGFELSPFFFLKAKMPMKNVCEGNMFFRFSSKCVA